MDDEPMNTAPTPELPPPMSPPPPPRPSWWHVPIARDPSERKVGGVVAGIAKAYGFDLRTTRIAVAIAAVALPGVIALYIAAMILLPARPAEARALSAIVTERRRRPLLITLGIVAVVTGFGSWAFFGGLGWGFTLVAVGVVLWLAPNFGTGLGRTNGPTTGAVATDPHAAPANDPPDSPTPHRRRYPVQALGLAGAAVTALLMGIGNSTDWWHATVYSIAVTVLAILVGATVIGVIVNRSWFGVPMLAFLLLVSAGLLVTNPNLDGGFGDRTLTPITVADALHPERLGAGRLTFDLTTLPAGDQPVSIDAQIGFGQIRIVVPADYELHLVTRTGAGQVLLDGREIVSGVRHDDDRLIAASSAVSAHRTITLHLDIGAGEIEIERLG